MTKNIQWLNVYMYMSDHGMIDEIDRATMSALRRYIIMNSVTVREVAIMLSVYMVGMSVDAIARGLMTIA